MCEADVRLGLLSNNLYQEDINIRTSWAYKYNNCMYSYNNWSNYHKYYIVLASFRLKIYQMVTFTHFIFIINHNISNINQLLLPALLYHDFGIIIVVK